MRRALDTAIIKRAGGQCLALRRSAGLTQKQFIAALEKRTGIKISISLYSRIETGRGETKRKERKEVPWHVYERITDAFGLDLKPLLADLKLLRSEIMNDALALMAHERLSLMEGSRQSIMFSDRQLDLIDYLTECTSASNEELQVESEWYRWLQTAQEKLPQQMAERGWEGVTQAEKLIRCYAPEDFLVWVGDWKILQPLVIETLGQLSSLPAPSCQQSRERDFTSRSNNDATKTAQGADKPSLVVTCVSEAPNKHGSETRIFKAHKDQVAAIAFHPSFSSSGGRLLSASERSCNVILWDINSGLVTL